MLFQKQTQKTNSSPIFKCRKNPIKIYFLAKLAEVLPNEAIRSTGVCMSLSTMFWLTGMMNAKGHIFSCLADLTLKHKRAEMPKPMA